MYVVYVIRVYKKKKKKNIDKSRLVITGKLQLKLFRFELFNIQEIAKN